MQFPTPLIRGRLIQRYKRYLADVQLDDGPMVTAHVPNPGAMLGLNSPGMPVWLSTSDNPKRKLGYTLEMVEVHDPASGSFTNVGVNTMNPNKLVAEALARGTIPELAGYSVRPEVKYGEASRIDFLLTDPDRPACWLEVKNCNGNNRRAERHWLEVKNCHFKRTPGLAEFPDCKVGRSVRHMEELANRVREGDDATVLWVVQMSDVDRFSISHDIDPVFSDAVHRAADVGVKVMAFACEVTPASITLRNAIPWVPRSV